ncbi:MAG: hypothetical protein R8F63_14080 [Acidimicrobiales bacterium]|nr:hypothetical protein [Acidimicrobiales bacterium]
MEATGIIFTALDTDHDNIESWNRWYDLEHLPPNLAMPEIAGGCRYVAPPELHEIRLPTTGVHGGFEDGKGVNVTIYLTAVDPGEAIQAMTGFREVLEAAGRMEGAGRRTVRTGDAMDLSWVVGDPVLRLDDRDVPHVGHTGIRVVLRRGDGDARAVAERAVAVDGVHGVMSFASRFFPGLEADIHLLSGVTADVTLATRAAAPYGAGAEIVLDAPFDGIAPLDYAFAARIRASSLPATLDTDAVMAPRGDESP